MIMTVDEFRRFATTDKEDQALEAMLQALELLIRGYTSNNFQHRGFRRMADIFGDTATMAALQPFAVGDTVQVTASTYNEGLYTVTAADDSTITVKGGFPHEEDDVYITKVVYPPDVKMGVANLLKWEIDNRDKVGVASETISRHSVTYFDMSSANSLMGYPSSLLGFLRPYMKARFGQGVRV